MASWSWGKTFAFAILYLFILIFTWKFRIGDVDMKWRLLTTIASPIVIFILLYIREK